MSHRLTRLSVALLAITASLAVSPVSAATKLGGPGTGAPQSEACLAAGGTEDDRFCVLPNGDKCDSMKLFRDNVCEDPDGNIIEETDDGANLPPADGGATDSGDDQPGGGTTTNGGDP
jgi:putative hemolysin